MQLFNKTSLPNAIASWLGPILSRFKYLRDNQPISLFDYFVTPVGGDTSYTVLRQGDYLYVLVTTDHPDPRYHSNELKKLSEKYTFSKLVFPDGKIISSSDALKSSTNTDFFIKEGMTYYYTALAENL